MELEDNDDLETLQNFCKPDKILDLQYCRMLAC